MVNPQHVPHGSAFALPEAEASVSLGVYVQALWRRKWLALGIAVLILAAGGVITYLQPRIYESTALLAFSSRSPGAFTADAEERITGSVVNSQIPLIKRAAFLNEIARDPDLALATSAMFRRTPDIVDALDRRLKVTRLKDTDILAIAMEGEDPRLITRTVNRIADLQRARIEASREASTAAAVQEYTKKIADMTSQLAAINHRIWSRANSAGIAGLTFGDQQKDGRVIVEAFRRRHDALIAQRTEIRRQLDLGAAELAAATIQFDAVCKSFVGDAAPLPAPVPAPKPDAGSASPAPATGKPDAPPASSDASERPADRPPVLTAAQLAALHLELGKVTAEIEKTGQLVRDAAQNPYAASLLARQAELSQALDEFRRQLKMQEYAAQQAMAQHTAAQDKVAKLAERIAEITEFIEARKQSLTAEALDLDPNVKLLRARKATLDQQYEEERRKLEESMGALPQILAEMPKIQQMESAAPKLAALRIAQRIQTESLDKVQAEINAIGGPLTDMLNEFSVAERIEQTYERAQDWVRDVRLALSQTRVTVHDAIEPPAPIRPDWRLNLAFSGVLGVMGAVGLALLLELTRKTVKTPSEVQQTLALNLIGVVPHFRALNSGHGVLPLDAFKDGSVLETFNEIRFSIHALREKNPPRAILVTSATAGEGKSTVAVMLACSLARAGERVLLVDGNVRLPYLHAVFHCAQAPGLGEAIQSSAPLRECLRATSVANLHLMPTGRVSEDGLAWLQPEEFGRFVRAARAAFDHVIFDATSTIGVADVRIIASTVDTVIYVVQSDRRNRSLVLRGVDPLRTLKADILGVILNNADYTRGDHYHFLKRSGERAIMLNGRDAPDPAAPTSEDPALRDAMKQWAAAAEKSAPSSEPPDAKPT